MFLKNVLSGKLFIVKTANRHLVARKILLPIVKNFTMIPLQMSPRQDYGNILLQSGLRHIEINMPKASFKLLWDVWLRELAILMRYKSIWTQTECQIDSDHHKSMQLLELSMFAAVDKLLYSYCKMCWNTFVQPHLDYYHTWNSTNPNRNFSFDVTFD